MLGKKSINMRKQSEKKHLPKTWPIIIIITIIIFISLSFLISCLCCCCGWFFVGWECGGFALCTCILYVGSIRLSIGPKNILIHTLHTRIKPTKLDIYFIFYGFFIFRFVNLTYFNPFLSFASFRPKCIQEKSYFPWKFITFCVLSLGCVIILFRRTTHRTP